MTLSNEPQPTEGLWQRFRNQPVGRQWGAWIVAAIAVIAVFPAPDEASKTTNTKPTPAATATEPPTVTEPPTITKQASVAAVAKHAPPPPPAVAVRKSPRRILNYRLVKVHAKVQSANLNELVIAARTPTGGLEGPSTGDLNDKAGEIFEAIYRAAGYGRNSVIVFKGGLYDSSTGADEPNARTGVYRMSSQQANAIKWQNEDRLLLIEWKNYREYGHPALKQDEGGLFG